VRAADAGDTCAIFNIGSRRKRGDGVLKDEAQAVEMCTRAVDAGIRIPCRVLETSISMAMGMRSVRPAQSRYTRAPATLVIPMR
jgi:hypothetical protein